MRPLAALTAGLTLMAVSIALLVWARDVTDVAAIIGSTGMLIAGALLGLTFLAWRWRDNATAYSSTIVDVTGLYEELGATVLADEVGRDDASAVG
ncbi:MAG: hypothetical protein ABI200_02305 [Gaiellales bacterium]